MVQNFYTHLIPSFGQDTLPNGDPKNAWLLSLEKIGSSNLSKDILESLHKFHTKKHVPNDIRLRITPSPALKKWRISKYNIAFTIALLGNQQRNLCSFCQSHERRIFEGCYFLEGLGNGQCANSVYCGGPAKASCQARPQSESSTSSSSEETSEEFGSKLLPQGKSKKRKTNTLEESTQAGRGVIKGKKVPRTKNLMKKRSRQKERSVVIKSSDFNRIRDLLADVKDSANQLASSCQALHLSFRKVQIALDIENDSSDDDETDE